MFLWFKGVEDIDLWFHTHGVTLIKCPHNVIKEQNILIVLYELLFGVFCIHAFLFQATVNDGAHSKSVPRRFLSPPPDKSDISVQACKIFQEILVAFEPNDYVEAYVQ